MSSTRIQTGMYGDRRKHVHDRRTYPDQDTLNGSLVYYFDVWVGDQVGQEAIRGMHFMVPEGIRLDLGDVTLVLPDEVMIVLAGRRLLYGTSMQPIVIPEQHVVLLVGRSTEIKIANNQYKVCRGTLSAAIIQPKTGQRSRVTSVSLKFVR